MIAKEYLGVLPRTCTFIDWDKATNIETACQKPAVAVYVSDDEEPKGRYVCQYHAEDAERHGDGPVFWQRFPVPSGDEENRLTLAHEEN